MENKVMDMLMSTMESLKIKFDEAIEHNSRSPKRPVWCWNTCEPRMKQKPST